MFPVSPRGQMELNYTMKKILNTEFPKDFNKQMEVRGQVHEKLAEIKKILFPNMWTNESHGYNSTPFIGNVYQIYRSILHFLAVDEGWDNVYSGLTLKSGELGTVKITKK